MIPAKKSCYDKRGELLVKHLTSRNFEAYYCSTKEEALHKALELIPEGSTIGWGGCTTGEEIGLIPALRAGANNVNVIDRDTAQNPAERVKLMKQCLTANVFITSANAISMDGQMVNIDGAGNRVAAIVYGPDSVVVVAGMNKVADTLEAAVTRARTVAAPANKQRFADNGTPCLVTGTCADCKSPLSICNQLLITRNCRPAGRIKFVLIGEDLGL